MRNNNYKSLYEKTKSDYDNRELLDESTELVTVTYRIPKTLAKSLVDFSTKNKMTENDSIILILGFNLILFTKNAKKIASMIRKLF